ncbi:phage gene 29 protein family protein [Corynebacterium flavescens]|uniref:phage gene 29 protein family protein n=1 Tax=Corynebacterium flavescens TaxID=28028 RepID=UPI0026480A59|nr:DUF2744 domain-containing protein [Corynebacterium flavescens]MDN6199379.1 DUF2744 domain-containing protein [Corynebacterium flavescens]MDN6227455.1 DUF2744 domain-containing protein [Corynebacterium flavescens]
MTTGIPLQHECNLDDPEEMFLWMFTALPGVEDQAPLLVPPSWARKWSRRLYDAGARFHPDEQTIKYVPPAGGAGTTFLNAGGGRWAPLAEELTPAETAPSIDHLSIAEKRELVKKLQEEGLVSSGPTPEAVEDQAEVMTHGD